MNKRIVIEGLLLAAFAVLALTCAGLWLKTKEFHHIRELAVSYNQDFVVFDETKNNYIFWIFDRDGRLANKIREPKRMTTSGTEFEYSGMALIDGDIYLQRRTYSDEGALIRESIIKKNSEETVEIFDIVHHDNSYERFLIGDLSVRNGTLFFMQVNMGQNLSILTLSSFDQDNGVIELAAVPVEDFQWNYTPAYLGNETIIFADDDSEIKAVNIEAPYTMNTLEKGGAIQSLAARDGAYAYFDLYSGNVVLNNPRVGILKASTDKLLSSKLCLRDDGVMVIEVGEQRTGRNIFFVNFTEDLKPIWQQISPNWFAQSGIFEALLYGLYAILIYIGLRVWLFLLLEHHIPVTLRIILIVAPLAVGCSAAFYYLSYRQIYNQITSVQQSRLKAIIQKEDRIDGIKQMILDCGEEISVKDERYIALANEMFELTGVQWNGVPGRTVMYYGIIRVRGKECYSFCFGTTFGMFRKDGNIRYSYKDSALEILRRCIEYKEEGYFTVPGEKMYYLYQTPVKDENESVVAVLEIGVDLNMLKMDAEAVARRQAVVVILMIGCLTGAFIAVIKFVLRSLGSLKSGVERITGGERNVIIPATTKDELGEIADAFNRMSAYVDQKSMDDAVFDRFIPREVSGLLNRDAVTAALGDHEELNLSVLGLDMRLFYNKKAELSFEELEYCYSCIEKIIRQEKGYMRPMDSTRGFSLFQDPAHALDAAFEICRSLKGLRAVIDFGEVTVAILGSDSHLQTAAVALAMERLRILQHNAHLLGASLILTEEAFLRLEAPDIYRHRFLGAVRIGEFVMKLYDFFDSDDKEALTGKSAALKYFNDGVRLFYEGNKRPARDKFIRALKLFPGDAISRRYLSLCEEEGGNCLIINTERS